MSRAERWRPIPGWGRHYEMSDRGRVRRVETGRVLAGSRHGITLHANGRRETRGWAKLQFETWGTCPEWGAVAKRWEQRQAEAPA